MESGQDVQDGWSGKLDAYNVMLIYIRVFVVLTWHYSRKESEKLDITFRQTQLCLPEFWKYYKYSIFSKFIDINWACLVGLFCHTLGLGV